MKVESRGKYEGVKIHLDAEEAKILLQEVSMLKGAYGDEVNVKTPIGLARKMGLKIREKLKENPKLLEKRTDEEIAAILVKEVEKASLQLERVKSGKDWKKVNKEELEKALLKHVPKE